MIDSILTYWRPVSHWGAQLSGEHMIKIFTFCSASGSPKNRHTAEKPGLVMGFYHYTTHQGYFIGCKTKPVESEARKTKERGFKSSRIQKGCTVEKSLVCKKCSRVSVQNYRKMRKL